MVDRAFSLCVYVGFGSPQIFAARSASALVASTN